MTTKTNQHNDTPNTVNPYQVSLSPRFAILSLASVSLTCFALGCAARQVLPMPSQPVTETPASPSVLSLPPLFVAPHKPIPNTRYTAKHYDTAKSIGSDMLVSKKYRNDDLLQRPTDPPTSSDDDDDEEEEIHEPAGQHLLIDIEHVDGAFLNSEHHLAQAMIDLVNHSGLTMLSYHCHKLLPVGISCAGVLLESHVSFHTWPVQGVITLDLFTCGPNSLLNLLGEVESLFAIPDRTKDQAPNMVWAFKRRGFETDEGYTPGISDLGTTLLGVLEFPKKEQVSFFQTPYQSVHIYNVLDPRYSKDQMERRMYLDGVLQARQRGQAAYAEAFVHPALLTHSNPRRVAIVGGGDGATLREVLKHASIERVQVVEIDQAVAEISQQWLWSQCGDFLMVSNCRQDDRVQEYYQDGFEWFQERYGNASKLEADHQDVIILDVLNPEDDVDFSEVFYDDLEFAQTLYGALTEDGILVAKLGAGPSLNDPPEQWTRARRVPSLVANLEQAGFAFIHEYEDSHGGMLEHETSSFLVAFKSAGSRSEWSSLSNEALGQIKLQERLLRTKSGKLPLSYVDAATLQSYQMPSRVSEVMFCRNQQAKNKDFECHAGLDPNQELSQDAMTTCAAEWFIPETSAALMNQLGLSPARTIDNTQSSEPYNPFRTRHAFVNACVSKNASKKRVQPPTLEMKLTPMEDEEQETAADPVQLGACDSPTPNLTSKELSAEGECTASAEQAIYDTLSS